jgi:hypothetical protein
MLDGDERMTAINTKALQSIHDLPSLLAFLRRLDPGRGLGWPIRSDLDAEELFYDYTSGDFLRSGGDSLCVWQLAKLEKDQPWGIFLLQTATPRIYTTQLRRLLRLLAALKQQSFFNTWPLENILFIATQDFHQFTFAHFRGDAAATARLSTFGWTQSQVEVGVRTLAEYNLPALHWPEDPADGPSWLAQWSAAFDVEKVTDRFFKEFRDLFEGLKEQLPKSIQQPAERHMFVQRILNRLLFLSFLQKKRWLKAPQTPHPSATYLFDLFDRAVAQGENFYGDYLQDLFFNALNRHPLPDGTPDPSEARLGIVPFLNGGLFDRVDEWDAQDQVKLSNDFFQPILGRDGLLRRYNFTVTESTPLNQEVAVDPEMLGKVFETVVLTSEGAENYQAPNLRKATGSYYTPRIVVTFILREALKSDLCAHIPSLRKENLTRLMEMDALSGLNVDDRTRLGELISSEQAEGVTSRLDALRVCDPAIGSGAFALGLLHEVLNLRLLCENVTRRKDPLLKRNLSFDYKKRIIERSIYGVDLQGKAVEICKLRLWLSLVVDYELDVDPDHCTEQELRRAVREIPPLPNLAFKIKRGDSLLDLIHGKPFRLEEITHNAEMQAAVTRLEGIHSRFFEEDDPYEKRALRLLALSERTNLSLLQLDQQLTALENRNATQDDMFAVRETKAAYRTAQAEREQLEAARDEMQKAAAELKVLARKPRLDENDDAVLNRLEAASENEEITFTWELDFPEIFFESSSAPATIIGKMNLVNQTRGQLEMSTPVGRRGGFDIIVGNPPFVTARNKVKRELYRERWKETCYLKFQLVAPFFQRSFGLLRSNGYLGFIVSNAFAKREFGKPLVEKFFPTIELQKIVDCSGLMFPGHGTPTCIVFGYNRKPDLKNAIRITATLPGGGDLRTMPEHSELWKSIEAHYDNPNYLDEQIMVADRPRIEMSKWPLNIDVSTEPTKKLLESSKHSTISTLSEAVGPTTLTRSDEIFIEPQDFLRRLRFDQQFIRVFIAGDNLRDWSIIEQEFAIFPYLDDYSLAPIIKLPELYNFLKQYKEYLENVIIFGKPKKETDRAWFEYTDPYPDKNLPPRFVAYPEITTHAHFYFNENNLLFPQTSPAIKFASDKTDYFHHTLSGILNSGTALFWLKQVCFNKNAGENEERDRFVYAGGKVELLPIPSNVTQKGLLQEKLTLLSQSCWERGQQLPALGHKKLFEQAGEAYHDWYSSLSGYISPYPSLGERKWHDPAGLLSLREKTRLARESLRSEMIALQEEMDWLVYAAYGLIPLDHPAVGQSNELPEPLALGERPFELLKSGSPIPSHFSPARKALWEARLKIIQENEHIRRIEQPVYKRRWYQKIKDEQEFQRAVDWFLLEKAEWWLEHVHKRPVALEIWAKALWEDPRIRAAAQAADSAIQTLALFTKFFKSIVVESAVPEWIPPAMPWEEVEKKFKTKVPARAKKIRGKLNVPRERFRVREDGQFVWAGEKDE